MEATSPISNAIHRGKSQVPSTGGHLMLAIDNNGYAASPSHETANVGDQSLSVRAMMKELREGQELLLENMKSWNTELMEHLRHQLPKDVADKVVLAISDYTAPHPPSTRRQISDYSRFAPAPIPSMKSGSGLGSLPENSDFGAEPSTGSRPQIPRSDSPMSTANSTPNSSNPRPESTTPPQVASRSFTPESIGNAPRMRRLSNHSAMSKSSNESVSMAVQQARNKTVAERQRSSRRDSYPSFKLSKCIRRIIEHPGFDTLCGIVILLNVLLLGISAEHGVDHDEDALWMKLASHSCNLFFFFEACLRVVALGKQFLLGGDKAWNIFDSVLVCQSMIDFVFAEGGGMTVDFKGLKTLKLLRLTRVIRVFRFFRELSIMVLMVANSMMSLTWALLLLFFMIYSFAILITQVCTVYIREHPNEDTSTVFVLFGTMARTMYSLILSILNGVSWGKLSDALMVIGPFPTGLFVFYIAFSMLAVLNIITGVFVENAVEIARSRKDVMLEKIEQTREIMVAELREIFRFIDEDESGSISQYELDSVLHDPVVLSYFRSIGMERSEVERLYQLIDEDGSGDVGIDDLLGACLRLKGEARSIDVYALLRETKKIEAAQFKQFQDSRVQFQDSQAASRQSFELMQSLTTECTLVLSTLRSSGRQDSAGSVSTGTAECVLPVHPRMAATAPRTPRLPDADG